MHLYVDSSALLKRVLAEDESDALVALLDEHHARGDLLVSSALAWIEVSRALSRSSLRGARLTDAVEDAMSGIDESPMSAEVVSLARRVGPPPLRTVDAIHVASAVLVDADLVLTYDTRLVEACRRNALAVTAPGRT